jgi:hypothetical protein
MHVFFLVIHSTYSIQFQNQVLMTIELILYRFDLHSIITMVNLQIDSTHAWYAFSVGFIFFDAIFIGSYVWLTLD